MSNSIIRSILDSFTRRDARDIVKFIEVVKRGVDFLLVSRTGHVNIACFKATTYRDNFSIFIERKYNCSRNTVTQCVVRSSETQFDENAKASARRFASDECSVLRYNTKKNFFPRTFRRSFIAPR